MQNNIFEIALLTLIAGSFVLAVIDPGYRPSSQIWQKSALLPILNTYYPSQSNGNGCELPSVS